MRGHVVQRVLDDDLKQEDMKNRDPNADDELGIVRDPFTREITATAT